MKDSLWLADLYMRHRQRDLLDEAEQARLAHWGANYRRILHLVAATLSRIQSRLAIQERRTQQHPDPESAPSTQRKDVVR